MSVVLDASVMLTLLYKQDGYTEVISALASGSCPAHAINLCEVYYDFQRTYDSAGAEQAIIDLRKMGVVCREDFDEELWKTAGRIKAVYKRVSLADCFCVALAGKLNMDVLTSDRHEMEPLANAGVCRVQFIR